MKTWRDRKREYLFGSLLALLISVASPFQAQTRIPFTNKMARAVRRVEPGWRYIGGWCSCPPTVPGQVWRDNGTWDRKDKQGRREFVDVEIVLAASAEESAEWIRRFGGGTSSRICQVAKYQMGDEAYLLTCPRSFKSTLNYRKGAFLVRVHGDSQKIVERFGRYTLAQLPAR